MVCKCCPVELNDSRLLCGHRTLWFLLNHFGVSTSLTVQSVETLVSKTRNHGGIVFASQLLESIQTTLTKHQLNVFSPLAMNTANKGGLNANNDDTVLLANRELERLGKPPLTQRMADEIDLLRAKEGELISLATTICVKRQRTNALVQGVLNGGVVVLLVDTRFLPYSPSTLKQLPTYHGHFITLHQYDHKEKRFQVYDSMYRQFQYLTVNQLNKTRRLSAMVCSATTIIIKPPSTQSMQSMQSIILPSLDRKRKLDDAIPSKPIKSINDHQRHVRRCRRSQ